MWADLRQGARAVRDLDAGDALPVGVVTFLLTDVVGSSRLWERDPEQARCSLMAHRRLIDTTVKAWGGARPQEQGEGDSTLSAFSNAAHACGAALEIQDRLAANPDTASLQLRTALFTGEAQLMDVGNYLAASVNRCARLRALAHPGQILLSRQTFEAARELLPEAELKDLGMHRLKDLTQAEHVFQLSRPGHGTFPPLSSLDAFTNNLPVQLTTFVARPEVDELTDAVPAHRLVTLTGSGGCGKTRLALQTAASLVDSYPDGVWFVELSAVSDPEQVTSEVARALLLQPGALQSSLETLLGFLKGRTLLLVWDNCEHVVQACAALADVLLRECQGLTLLTTSREALGVPGEVIWQVASLSTGPAQSAGDTETLMQHGAIRLFVERAVEARQDFRLDAACAASVAAICRRLDGIPLAIELAAARVRILTPAEILTAIQDSFQLLNRGSRTAMARHQTIEASIEWSYSSLSELEQLVFERLSPFWSFTLEEAQKVCGFSPLQPYEVLDVVASLIDKSLVQVEVDDTHTRYRMLATIRQFAARRLFHRGETATLLLRHTNNFLELLDESREHLEQGDIAWLNRLDDESDNLRSAVLWSLSSDVAAVVRCALPLAILSGPTGRAEETLSWLDDALAAVEVGDAELRATALYAKAVIAAYRLDVLAVLPVAQDAYALFLQLGHEQGVGRSSILAGFAQTFLGDAETGLALIEQGIETARRLEDRFSLRLGLLARGYCLMHQDVELGRACFAECLEMHTSERIADLALVMAFQSWCDLRQGRWRDARTRAARTAELAREQHQRQALAISLVNEGEALVGLGLLDEAGPLAAEAERICLETQDLAVYGITLSLRCLLLHAQGDAAAAKEAGQLSVSLLEGTAPQFNCFLQLRLARIELAAGEYEAFAGRVLRAAGVAARYSLAWPLATAVFLQASALLRQNRPGEATAGALDALTRFTQVADDSGLVETVELLADIALALHRDRDAARLLAAAHARRERTGFAILPVDQPDHDRRCSVLNDRLGDRFAQEWHAGAGLDLADLSLLAQELEGASADCGAGRGG